MNHPAKLDLQKDGILLNLFMYTVQNSQIPQQEDFKAVMAYTQEEAIDTVRRDYVLGVVIAFTLRAQVSVKSILDIVNIDQTIASVQAPIVPPVPAKEKTEKDFVYGMMLVSDKFIKDEVDKEVVKKILSKIVI